MRVGFAWAALAVALAACGGGEGASARDRAPARSDTVVRAPVAHQKTIVFLGTSLTAGLGLDPEQAYPALIAQRIDSLGLNYRVVNAGVSGETSAGAVRRIDWLLRDSIDVIVLETGANDGLRGLSVDSLRENIQRIIDKVRAAHPSAQFVLAGMEAPPNIGPRYTAAFRRVYPELAKKNGAVLIPFLLRDVAGVDTLNQPDGIHPNVRGERIVADNVWRVLRQVLEESGSA